MNVIRHHRPGYVLFEVVLALTIFAIAVVGLARSLNLSLEASGAMNRENAIRTALRSFIEETRRKEIADMSTETRDARLDAVFSSNVEELTMKNQDGTVLNDLYVLHARAKWNEGRDEQQENIDLYLYKPQPAQSGGTSGSTTGTASRTATTGSSGTGRIGR